MISIWKVKFQYVGRNGDTKEIDYSVITKECYALGAVAIAEVEMKKHISEYSLVGIEYLGQAYQ